MKTLFLLDPGHGGIVNGQYVTAGKRSPLLDDGSVLYEGVNNRDNVRLIIEESDKLRLQCVDIVNSQDDISLTERAKRANNIYRQNKNCVYISMHSDAGSYQYTNPACTIRYDKAKHGTVKKFYYKEEWHEAKGISVYTSLGQTKSDVFAAILVDELELAFGDSVKFRKDTTDKDEDKEAHFYVLEKTLMPAVLIEAGFHTNKEEAKRMLTKEWKNSLVNAITNAMLKWEKLNQSSTNG